jgi:hypothetical protein
VVAADVAGHTWEIDHDFVDGEVVGDGFHEQGVDSTSRERFRDGTGALGLVVAGLWSLERIPVVESGRNLVSSAAVSSRKDVRRKHLRCCRKHRWVWSRDWNQTRLVSLVALALGSLAALALASSTRRWTRRSTRCSTHRSTHRSNPRPTPHPTRYFLCWNCL